MQVTARKRAVDAVGFGYCEANTVHVENVGFGFIPGSLGVIADWKRNAGIVNDRVVIWISRLNQWTLQNDTSRMISLFPQVGSFYTQLRSSQNSTSLQKLRKTTNMPPKMMAEISPYWAAHDEDFARCSAALDQVWKKLPIVLSCPLQGLQGVPGPQHTLGEKSRFKGSLTRAMETTLKNRHYNCHHVPKTNTLIFSKSKSTPFWQTYPTGCFTCQFGPASPPETGAKCYKCTVAPLVGPTLVRVPLYLLADGGFSGVALGVQHVFWVGARCDTTFATVILETWGLNKWTETDVLDPTTFFFRPPNRQLLNLKRLLSETWIAWCWR